MDSAMDTLQFLRTVWPETGLYALAIPFTPPGAKKSVYRHRIFDTVDAAAAEASRLSGLADVFFAVHTLRERQVWNPLKKNFKDGTLGAFEVRTHANMAEARAFFFDLDVEPGNPAKYDSPTDALAAIGRFCKTAALPLPLVVGSGVGLHVYWPLDGALDSVAWRQLAEQLRGLAAKLDLRVDPARTTDVSSVLRVPGTMHLKDRENPKLVVVQRARTAISRDLFAQNIRDACVTHGVTTTLTRRPLHDDDPMPDIGSNTEKIYADRPPPTLKSVLAACAQMRHIYDNQRTVSEPEWFQALNIVKFVEEPAVCAHAISAGHPKYTKDDTDDKFGRILASSTGPTSCAILAATCGEARCGTCRFSGRVKNPIMAARLVDEAPAPEIATQAVTFIGAEAGDDDEPPMVVSTLPNPPKPFRRVRGGGVVMDVADKDGEEMTVTIYDNDLHPVKRVVNAAEQVERQFWRVTLPREAGKDFALDSDALYDIRKLMVVLANNGIYPSPNQIPNLRDYMIAYITVLQNAVDAEPQSGHLGWSDEHDHFILPHGAIYRDGSLRPVSLTKQGERVSVHIHKKGTLAAQVEALKFYDHEAYIPQQFYIMGGLAATLLHMTGHHGVISHLQGRPGKGKSTNLYTAASFWGHPKLYAINGTNSGATVRGRNERVSTLANLPVLVDEVTNLPAKDAADLAMNITQPGHRIRLDVTGTERAAHGGYKSTILMTTANSSLHTLLSSENSGTAGSMRVFEILVDGQQVHQKWEADAYLQTIEENYGHIGEVFIAYVLQHYDLVHERVRAAMRYVDERGNIEPAERFWSALVAVTIVAAGISRKLGLTSWSPEAMVEWVLNTQLTAMRSVVKDEYTDPVNLLTNYMSEIYGSTIVINSAAPSSQALPGKGRPRMFVERPPRSNSLLAQIDIGDASVLVSHKHFKDYCRKVGGNWRETIAALYASGHITGRARRVIGGDTEHAGAATEVHVVNGEHIAVAQAVKEVMHKIDNAPDNVVPLKKNAGSV